MKLVRWVLLPLCLAVICSAGPIGADGWGTSKSSGAENAVATTLKRIDTGTKRLVRGTVDVVTLKPLWPKKQPAAPPQPWLNHTRTKKKAAKKESFWSSLSNPKDSSEPKTMRDFVGMERPS